MSTRTHIVMVPGFGGFDALGQLKYYAGVTEAFDAWRTANAHVAALHYYENYPTSSVRTRAKGLRLFLTKLMFRGIVAPGDTIALVGHSTGGLDIRQALLDLDEDEQKPPLGAQEQPRPSNRQVLRAIKRVTFLSVPQRGSNIADWMGHNKAVRAWLIHGLRQLVGVQGLLGRLDPSPFILGLIDTGESELKKAWEDAQRDKDGARSKDAWVAAQGRRAKGNMDAWLRDVDRDFMAIDDLASAPAAEGPADRLVDGALSSEEQAAWAGLETRSYATMVPWPFAGQGPREPRNTTSASSWALLKASRNRRGARPTDEIFRMAYAACAAGPFDRGSPVTARWLEGMRPKDAPERYAPETWDNDGIVNTASMLWPNGEDTLLVPGDHADIIGHFKLQEIREKDRTKDGRKYDAYDLLGSGSQFTRHMFERIWRDVFDFSASAHTARR